MINLQRDIIRFEKGAILRKEMLESMYNYPRFLAEGYYALYGDGILYGLEWFEVDGKHCISPGAIKYKGNIFFQTDTIVLEDTIIGDDLKLGQEYYIYFKETPVKHSYSQDVYDLVLSLETEPINDGFCYKYIKYELKSFKALDNKKVYGLFASPVNGGFSIPVHIIKAEILPILAGKKAKHPLDFEIMKNVYSNQPLPVDVAKLYISEYNASITDQSSKKEINITQENVRELINGLKTAVEALTFSIELVTVKAESCCEPTEENENKGGGQMLW